MGVHGLWRLLDPFGQVTRPEDWTDRRVAIDASIWMVQFRAKVDASEDVESKVLEGFLSRILKLLFYGIEAVFVFDGTSSSLKTAEQSKRARQREAATQVFLRKRAKQIMMAQVAAGQLNVNALPMQMTSSGDDNVKHVENGKVKKAKSRVKRSKELPPSRAMVLLRKSVSRKRERSTSLHDQHHFTKEEEKEEEEEERTQDSKVVEGANDTENTINTHSMSSTYKPANYYGVTIHPHIARLAPDAVSASVVKHFLADARELQAEADKGEQMISQNVLKHTSTALFMGPRKVAEGNTSNTVHRTEKHKCADVQKLHHKTHTIVDDSPVKLSEEKLHEHHQYSEKEVEVIGNENAIIVDIDDSQPSTDQKHRTTNEKQENQELLLSSSSYSSSFSSSSSTSVVIEVAGARHNVTFKVNEFERKTDDDDEDVKIVEVNRVSRSPSIKEYKAESNYPNTTYAHNKLASSPSVTSVEEVKPMSNLDILRAVSAEIDWHGSDEKKSNNNYSYENDEKENKYAKSISFSPSPSSQESLHDNNDGELEKKEESSKEQEINWQAQREENLWNPSTQLMRCVEAQTNLSCEQEQQQHHQGKMENRVETPKEHQLQQSELPKMEFSNNYHQYHHEMEPISEKEWLDNKKSIVSSTTISSELSHLINEQEKTESIQLKLHQYEEQHTYPSSVIVSSSSSSLLLPSQENNTHGSITELVYSEAKHNNDNDDNNVQRTLPHRVLPADVIDIAQLLNLCGIPYVISPSEADAQCAYLAQAHLVDAVFSEDSDVVVHGAMTVLRGFFSSSQHAVEYRHDALATIGVNKRVLVALAMLLGCDYTNGVHGIGLIGALNAITVAWPLHTMEKTQCTKAMTTNIVEKQDTEQKQQQLDENVNVNDDTNYSTSTFHHVQTHNSHSLQDDVDAVHALLNRWRLLISKPLTRWEDTEDTMSLLQFTLLKENFAQWASLKVEDNFPSRPAIEAFYFPSIDNDKTRFPPTSPKWEELRVFAGTHGLLNSPWLTQRLQSAEKEFNKRSAARAAEMCNMNNMQHQRKLTEFGARTGVRPKWAYKKLSSTFATALANLRGVQEQQEQQQEQYEISEEEQEEE